MLHRINVRLAVCMAGGLFALAAFTAPARAQTTQDEIRDLRNQLKKQQQQIEMLQKLLESRPIGAGQAGVDQKRLESIVHEAVQKEKKKEKADKNESKTKDEWYQVGSDLSLKPKWKHGVTFSSPNGDFKMHFRGRMFYDMGWFDHDPTLPEYRDAAGFRAARLGISGTAWEVIALKAEYDFADGGSKANDPHDVDMKDVYMEIRQLPFVQNFRAGHFKEFFSLEQLTSARFITFMERSMVDQAFVPSRNTGLAVVRAYGDEDRFTAGTGWWRTNSNAVGFDNGDGGYSWTSRVTALPFVSSGGRCLFHIGGAYSHRAFPEGQGPRFRNRGPWRFDTPRLIDTGTLLGATEQNLWGAEAALVYGPFSIQGEAIWTDANLADGRDVSYWGYYVFASYFLTGEHRRYRRSGGYFDRIYPDEPYYFVEGPSGPIWGKGAWEVAVRYSFIVLQDGGVVRTSANAPTGEADTLTFGVNWYLNPQSRVMFNYAHAMRTVDRPNADGDVDWFGMRFQYDF